MDTIIITCPKCHSKNKVPTPSREGARIQCAHCRHTFKVVPKPRTIEVQETAAKQAETKVSADNMADRPSAILKPNIDHTRHSAPENSKTEKHPNDAPQPSISTLLSHPMPEPEVKTQAVTPEPAPSAVSTDKPPEQSNTVVDQSMKAALNKVSGNLTTEQLPAIRKESDADSKQESGTKQNTSTNNTNNTVNNLVFTLLSAPEHHQTQADMPLLLNDTIEKTETIRSTQKVLTEQQEKLHREFNWTLASLVALTVLIIQLFYLMAVR